MDRMPSYFTKRRMKYERKKQKKLSVKHGSSFAFLFAGTVSIILVCTHIVQFQKKSSAKKSICEFVSALQSYYDDCGQFPTWQQGLEALCTRPVLFPVPHNWNGPYLSHGLQSDPWGADFVYTRRDCIAFPQKSPDGLQYAIICYGADNIAGGAGAAADILSWKLD
jgi:general secretion pathway protein G